MPVQLRKKLLHHFGQIIPEVKSWLCLIYIHLNNMCTGRNAHMSISKCIAEKVNIFQHSIYYVIKYSFTHTGCYCEQQYRLHRLLAYDPHNECRGIFSDWFRFPSCCICKCYNVLDFRATSRSPRSEREPESSNEYKHPIDMAEEEVKKAIYEHATEEWYRPRDEFDLYE